MCDRCIEAVKKYYPGLFEDSYSDLLMSATSFPFGSPEYIEKQLIELRLNTDGTVPGAIAYAEKKLYESMQQLHDLEEGATV